MFTIFSFYWRDEHWNFMKLILQGTSGFIVRIIPRKHERNAPSSISFHSLMRMIHFSPRQILNQHTLKRTRWDNSETTRYNIYWDCRVKFTCDKNYIRECNFPDLLWGKESVNLKDFDFFQKSQKHRSLDFIPILV